MKVKITGDNAKLRRLSEQIGKKIKTFNLISGYSCPYAKDCKSRAVQDVNGKLHVEDGEHCQFRCYSASQEAFYGNVFEQRMANFMALRSCETAAEMADLILKAMPKQTGKVYRIHVAGDFFNQAYFDAWIIVAEQRPDDYFYTYTKALPLWIKRINDIPENLTLTASLGGTHDHLTNVYPLRTARVVYSEEEAEQLGLPIDHNDFNAYDPDNREQSFALLIHGLQPKGSEAGKAVHRLNGKGSYSRKRK